MNNTELQFFEAVKLFNEELYWDAIETFQNSLSEGLEDRYVDDCFLNIALCYMKLKLFNEAEEFFLKAVSTADVTGDKIDFEGPIYGKTSDRARLGLIRIALVKKNLEAAEIILEELRNSESYIEVSDEKVSMFDIGKSEIEKAKSSYL
jgi:tetratricopeptide (TPR) repeat protein